MFPRRVLRGLAQLIRRFRSRHGRLVSSPHMSVSPDTHACTYYVSLPADLAMARAAVFAHKHNCSVNAEGMASRACHAPIAACARKQADPACGAKALRRLRARSAHACAQFTGAVARPLRDRRSSAGKRIY